MKLNIFKTKTISILLTSIFAVALVLAAGCGGGGGGGAAAPPPSGGGNNGGGGGSSDKTAPTLALVDPAPGSSDTQDVELWDGNFKITFSYSDAAPIDEDSIIVTFQMDNGQVNTISSYFSVASQELKNGKYESNIVSSGIFQFTSTLFLLPPNTQARVMKVTFKAKDSSGNQGSVTSQFTVVPATIPG